MADGSQTQVQMRTARPRFWSGDAWSYGNANVSGTAARYVAKAMTRVHPRQRAELLHHIIRQATEALAVIQPEGVSQ